MQLVAAPAANFATVRTGGRARLKTVETDVKQYRSTGKRVLCAPPEKKLANFFLSRYFSFRNHFHPRSITIHPQARNQLSGVKRFSCPFFSNGIY